MTHPVLRTPLIVALLAMAVLAAACGGGPQEEPAGDGTETDAASGDETDQAAEGGEAQGSVRIGFISPTTGFVAALGTDMRRGWELYWELHGDTAGGARVETVFEDDAGDPEVALTKARRLVEEEEVDMVAGPVLANTAYAVADYVAGQGLPSLHITGADDLTQREFDELPTVLRVGYTSSQSNFPAGNWAAEQGYENAVTICPDYAFGWESCGGFVSGFEAAGGEITEQIWHPLGTQDFSTYVGQIQQHDPDVVFVGSAGGPDAILLYQAWNDFGLGDTPLIGNCCFADQVFMREVGETALGVESFTYWAEGRDSDAVREFVEAYEERHNEIPSLYAAGSYMMAQVTALTLEETGGKIDDGQEFIDTASSLTLEDSLYGSIHFDDYNNIVGPVHRTAIEEREDGTLWNVPQDTFDDVSQFWNYDPEEFLENPVFSRDFQRQ